mmetsp:Transcript_1448/g.3910  ORF Transcript_1448/g.3910 Transcript_1448/m.3910 type:complete len:215 (-) Transcript_1448:21-665(-)
MRASRRRHVHGGEAMLSPGAREGWTRRARVGGPLHFSDTHAEGGSNHFTDTRAWWDALWRRGGGGRDTCAAPTESCCTLTMDPGDTGINVTLEEPRSLSSVTVWNEAAGAPLIQDQVAQLQFMQLFVGTHQQLVSCNLTYDHAAALAFYGAGYKRWGVGCQGAEANATVVLLHAPNLHTVSPSVPVPPQNVMVKICTVPWASASSAPAELLLQV